VGDKCDYFVNVNTIEMSDVDRCFAEREVCEVTRPAP